MPHVIVRFDPDRVQQRVIDQLKKHLQIAVSDGLRFTSGDHRDVTVLPSEVYVRQQAAHPTDVNPAIIEIEIQAGRRKERSPEGVVYEIIRQLRYDQVLPEELLRSDECCIWLRFSEDNAFE